MLESHPEKDNVQQSFLIGIFKKQVIIKHKRAAEVKEGKGILILLAHHIEEYHCQK